MSSEKTEQPTHKKLSKAREDGQVAKSKDFTQTVLILALFGYILGDAPSLIRRLGEMMVFPASVLGLGFEDAANVVVTQLFMDAIWILLPFLLIVVMLGIFVEAVQTGLLISFKAAMPSGKKLNVAANLKNIFSKKNFVEFLKSCAKIAVLSAVIWYVLSEELGALLTLPRAGLLGVGVAVGMLLKSMIIKISIAYAVIALFDFAWQRKNHIQQLMMSKDEVKREYKEAEGDPQIKHARRHLHMEMLEEGAVERTRNASVVVTNPTHLAIAIVYKEGETPLPVVVAKGEDALATRMIVAARQAGVPVLQNIPLARGLWQDAQVDNYVPRDQIEAVAAVLRMVRDMKED
jgi:type III secretion protein U